MRYVYLLCGMIFLGVGCIGIIIPVLPTTPFLLVALFCFSRSSKRAEIWFKKTSIYQHHMERFVNERAMTRKNKVMLLSLASTMLLIAFYFMSSIFGRILIVLLIVCKYYYFIFRIKTIKEDTYAKSNT